jgi:hypothetical protein
MYRLRKGLLHRKNGNDMGNMQVVVFFDCEV